MSGILATKHLRRITSRPVPGTALTTVLLAVVVVAALYLGREVLVPIALAVLMSFVLAPPVRRLQAWYVPRILAVILVVLVAFAAIFSLGGLMVSQVNQLAADLPQYQSTLREKIKSLRGAAAGTGTLERASDVLQNLSKELDKPKGNMAPTTPLAIDASASGKPIAVEIRQPDPGALQTLVSLISPLVHPLATTGIVIIFVIFVLLQREDLRNRLVRLAGSDDLQRTTAAMDDAGRRLSRLFLIQLALNSGFGLVIGTGLWFIGVPSAPLWGVLAMILRFVPYIGAVISAIFPLVLAAAVGQGWTMVLWTAALFLIVEPIVGHVVEPLLYGHSAGLSPVSVIASATFWTWLWGPIGLVLATPLTICLVVLGRHVDRLKFLDIMFGDQPALTPPELVYQRMLAGDPVEAAEQAQTFLKDRPLVAYYEEVLIGGLKLAHADAKRGLLDDERLQRIRDATAEIVDDLSAHEDALECIPNLVPVDDEQAPLRQIAEAEELPACQEMPAQWQTAKPVLCIPGQGPLDEAMALILAQLIEREGIGVRPESADALSMARIFGLDTKDVALVCLCYVANPTSAQVRYAIRRLRRKAPEAFMLVSIMGGLDNVRDSEEVRACQADDVRQSLSETIDQIKNLARGIQGATDQSEIVACGTPVPAFRQGSTSEITDQGVTGAV
jgi:predicted PurR-regulated permease PerM